MGKTVVEVSVGVSRCRGKAHISLHTGVVDDLVDVVCRNARLGCSSRDIENFASHSADLTHALLFLLGQNLDFVSSYDHLPKLVMLDHH